MDGGGRLLYEVDAELDESRPFWLKTDWLHSGVGSGCSTEGFLKSRELTSQETYSLVRLLAVELTVLVRSAC